MGTVLKEPSIDYNRRTVSPKDYYKSSGETWSNINEAAWKGDYFPKNSVRNSMHSKFIYKQKEDTYSFNVDSEKFEMPICLKHIANQIEEGADILAYEHDWDDDGGEATDVNTYLRATNFIVNYVLYIYNKLSTVITAPYIDILRDGSVSVFWETEKNTQLLIIFSKDADRVAPFYAQQGDREIPLKGAIVPGEDVEEILALWMKKHLK